MKALTLMRPWSLAIVQYGKNIENRSWIPPRSVIGSTIAIHSGKSIDYEAMEFIEKVTGKKVPEELPTGIIGTAILTGYKEVTKMKSSPWAFGPYCWLLEDPIILEEPISIKGSLGFWNVPEQYESLLIRK